MSIPKTGGTPLQLAAVSRFAQGIAVDRAYVYWAESEQRQNQDFGTIYKVPLGGGEAAVLTTVEHRPYRLSVQGGDLYLACSDVLGALYKVPTTGGTAMVLAEGAYYLDVVADDSNVYWLEKAAQDPSHASLRTAPRVGAPSRQLATSLDVGWHLALESGQLFWSAGADLLSMPATGGVPLRIGDSSHGDLIADGEFVYEAYAANLTKTSRSEGTQSLLLGPAQVACCARAIVSDADSLFVLTSTAVLRIAK